VLELAPGAPPIPEVELVDDVLLEDVCIPPLVEVLEDEDVIGSPLEVELVELELLELEEEPCGGCSHCSSAQLRP
jgi:hypothetical protein